MEENTQDTPEERDEREDGPELSHEERDHRVREGITNLLSGLLGIEPPPPPEVEARRELQEAVANEENWRNCQMATMVIVTAEGKEVLVTTTFLRDEIPLDQMESLESYLNEVARPALQQDQRIVIRTHEFTPEFFAQHCTGAFDTDGFSEHVATLRVKADAAARARKFKECEACPDEDCEDRETESP